jgi:hypothetical protein
MRIFVGVHAFVCARALVYVFLLAVLINRCQWNACRESGYQLQLRFI